MADVGNILDAAQQVRLTGLQKTARALDVASARLSSGLKVNSALDNPQSFFTARSLNHRAHDLNRLLDYIGQNIQAIKTADHAVKAQLQILDQAESYLTALETKYMNGEIVSGTGLAPNETMVTFAGPGDFTTYIVGQDGAGTVTVTGNNEVTFDGNLWKRKAFNYTVTADTVITFEYRSTAIQEVSTIGFDNDTNFGNDDDRFWIYGTQTSGITYSAPFPTYDYTAAGAWETIEIPVGTFFTGNFTHMTFVNDDDVAPLGNGSFRNIILREGPKQYANDVSAYEDGYAKLLRQFDMVADDARYRDVNLLKGQDMTTFFNEGRSSKLETKAMQSTYAAFELDEKNLGTLDDVRAELRRIADARETLRTYISTLAGDLNIIMTRQDFITRQIEIHSEGADKLILADMNEESARMLALQARQQLQTNILSLRTASILDIFA